MDQSLETQGEVALTSIAPEIVNVSCAAPDRTEACGSFVFNPATGALEIARAYREKAAKAVMRDLRRTKLGPFPTIMAGFANLSGWICSISLTTRYEKSRAALRSRRITGCGFGPRTEGAIP
jgi:hypothetical protein